MIRLERIDKYFNRFKRNQIHVINDTSLEFESTGLVALLGPSGSGKTTLLNVIGGLDKVRRGKIYINGKKITHRTQGCVDKTRNLNIGYIFQDYKLIDNLSVYDNVSIALKMVGIKDKKEIDKRVCYVLDRVGMLRYKKRPCGMLSGGERQRVGIARAIVKNPNIIIADEPTGNLDSKNSVEIMNIIKAISKDKLVILVTHEVNLAKFYASRIIELEDGKIINDYNNEDQNDLEYEISNNLYLKDYKYKAETFGITTYTDDIEPLNVKIVATKNNIYIETFDHRKVEVVDDYSSIEMKDEHRRNLTREDMDKYSFDYENIINKRKLRYSSIFNPITFITNGYKKVLDYSFIKKVLLLGFFVSGIFIMYAMSSILCTMTIKDKNFVEINKNYLIIKNKKNKLSDYLNYEKDLKAEYIIPSDSKVNLPLRYEEFYQSSRLNVIIESSLSSVDMITNEDVIMGRRPENANEIVLDKMAIENTLENNEFVRMIGLIKVKDFLDKKITINNMPEMTIVGITDLNSPAVYVSNRKLFEILYHINNDEDDGGISYASIYNDEEYDVDYEDYDLFYKKVTLKEGKWPVNDYETIVNISNKEDMKIGKEINKSINNHKLKVVGYYTSKDSYNYYLVNKNMIKYKTISKYSNIVVYSKNKEETMKIARDKYKLNIKDSYEDSKEKYNNSRKEDVKTALISAGIVLGISLIEILLMMRSSFLSRIKEVGTYRAIGVKKKDIYIMFSGEIIAITVMASIPGILICAYVINQLSHIKYLEEYFMINNSVILFSIILVFVFNLIVGLIPVYKTIRKRPAEILSRTDI